MIKLCKTATTKAAVFLSAIPFTFERYVSYPFYFFLHDWYTQVLTCYCLHNLPNDWNTHTIVITYIFIHKKNTRYKSLLHSKLVFKLIFTYSDAKSNPFCICVCTYRYQSCGAFRLIFINQSNFRFAVFFFICKKENHNTTHLKL